MTDMLAALPRRAAATRCGRCAGSAAQRAVRPGRHRPPGPALHGDRVAAGVREESPTGGRRRGPRERIFFAVRHRAAHHAVGARHRPDDPVRVHRRARRVRPGHPTARRGRAAAARSRATRSPRRPSPTWRQYRDHRVRPPRRRRALPRRPGRPHHHSRGRATTARPTCSSCATPSSPALPATAVSLRVIGHSRTFYDGDAVRRAAARAARRPRPAVRTESLVFDDGFLDEHVRPGRSAGGQPAARLPRPGRHDGLGPRSIPTSSGPDAGAGRLRPLRRRRRARLARRLLHRRRPAPLRRPRPATGCRAACRSARSTRSAPKAASATTSTTCSRRGRSTRSG